jgi:diguanylate cyclase
LILPSPPDATGLQRIAERIIRGLEVPIPFDGAICQISGSIGIAVSTDYAPLDIAAMQTDADAALYASKRAGRGRATRARRSETACRLAE